nr:MAG TPA: hypothetical protein [Caudoviricetes sp.]
MHNTGKRILSAWWNGRHNGLKIHRETMRVQVPSPIPI